VSPRFVQIHTLTSYPAALLNRDDAGFAKRIPFGGVPRIRISSQCLKRHWRLFDGEASLASIRVGGGMAPMSIRSRRTFERFVHKPLVAEGVGAEMAAAVTRAFMEVLLGESPKAKATKKEKEQAGEEAVDPGVRTNQITVLGRPEVDFILAEARAVCAAVQDPKQAKKTVEERFKKEAKKNLDALKRAAGLDAALFGRMVTSDILARGDAAIHVAHAFTTHGEEAETDYFSAMDDLLVQSDEGELGSGHINTSELTSGLFYGYLVVDVPLLVSNLEGCERKDWAAADRSLAAEVVRRLVQLVATVSPGAKLGSTAPYSYAHLVLAETGSAQPRTLANAFLKPVPERPDLVRNTYVALAQHLVEIDAMYGRSGERKLAARGLVAELDEAVAASDRVRLPELTEWVAEQIRRG
jgi:CRISPR system Cascade subunit CasC